MIKDIVETYPPNYQNNARRIARNLMEKMLESPSYWLEKRLNKIGIGVEWTSHHGEEGSYVEGFYKMEEGEMASMSDEEFGNLLQASGY